MGHYQVWPFITRPTEQNRLLAGQLIECVVSVSLVTVFAHLTNDLVVCCGLVG